MNKKLPRERLSIQDIGTIVIALVFLGWLIVGFFTWLVKPGSLGQVASWIVQIIVSLSVIAMMLGAAYALDRMEIMKKDNWVFIIAFVGLIVGGGMLAEWLLTRVY